jgi:hypothetical protein
MSYSSFGYVRIIVKIKYFTALNKKDRKSALGNLKDINNFQNNEKPILFQIMALGLPMAQKNHR